MKPGERVQFYAWVGGERQALVAATVVRVNRKTITVRTEYGAVKRVSPHLLAAREWRTAAERAR